jgi:leader peptidase (prepilin peptidase) / N-methyltransferase
MDLLLLALFFLLGAALASFTLVVVARYGTGQSIWFGRSRCDACNAPLPPLALVPLLSYAASRGRAQCCGAHVSPLSTIAEGTLGSLFALAFLTLGLTSALPVFLAALMSLLALVAYDLMHQVLPPPFLAVFIACALLFGALSAPTLAALALRAAIAGLLALFFLLMNLFSGGRWMGFSDAPLAFGLALLVGPAQSLPGFMYTFWIGAVIGIGILFAQPRGSRMGIAVPLAPFLAAGFLLAFFTQWNPFAPFF